MIGSLLDGIPSRRPSGSACSRAKGSASRSWRPAVFISYENSGRWVCLVTTAGFGLAFLLSTFE